MFQDFQPDLIFMDISMPEMDGKEAAGRSRAGVEGSDRGNDRPAMEGDEESILASGIDRYLTKPLRKTPSRALWANSAPGARPPVAAQAKTPLDQRRRVGPR